ncbi:MAG: glycosyltransferase family 2 protein [Chloroflexi bacterium]|nr:glycosyltransferase family 2 protein [Chloroflexota bacterium]
MIDLSIVIVSYNVRELLAQCLESVGSQQSTVNSQQSAGNSQQSAGNSQQSAGNSQQSAGNSQQSAGNSSLSTVHCSLSTEIFVVDNASRDASAAIVREKFPRVNLIANAENRGFATANNQAFVESRGRYVMMLNPDTQVKPGALETLVKFMDAPASRRAGACGGKLLYGDGALQHSAFAFPALAQIYLDFFPVNWRLTNSRLNGRYPRAWYARGAPFEIDHPLGADFLVRREVADQVGWLDDQFFIYCEEIDWAIRIKRAGWQIWCVPQAEIIHHEAQSTRQFRDAMFIELWRARKRLFEKHYSRAFRFAAKQIVRAGLANESRKARAANLSKEELQKRLDAYHQVWHNLNV